MTAFAAINGFGELQDLAGETNGLVVTLCVVLAGVTIMCLDGASEKVRAHIAQADGTVDEEEKAWIEQAEDTENDCFAICTGFLMMQSFRYYITGRIESTEPHEAPPHTSSMQQTTLFICSLLAGFVAFLTTAYTNRLR